MTQPAPPSIAAVVVHYRTPDLLRACLAALEAQGDVIGEILVVDNSGATNAAPAPGAAEGWRLHRAEENVGFGHACNLGARLTESDHVLFLNADLVLSEHAGAELVAAAQSHPRAAVFGPRILAADGEVELSARAFPSLRTGVLGRSSLTTRLLRRAGATPRAVSAALGERTRSVDWVSGACMLVRRRAFDEVGGFDEGYWMYWEDADLCRRLRDHGWETMLCVEAGARHSTGSSGRSERTIRAFHASAARYHKRHIAGGAPAAALARRVLGVRMELQLRGHAREVSRSPGPSAAGRLVLIEALAARFGGTVYATIELARHLAGRPDVAGVTVLTRRGSIVERELAGVPGVRCATLPRRARAELVRRTVWEVARLRRLVAREGFDALISMSGVVPRAPGCEVICLLGNSAMYESDAFADRLRRLAVRRTARRGAQLLAPSHRLAELVGASTGQRCEIHPLGVDHAAFHPAPEAGDEILCVADFYAHKRHDLVVDAWLGLPVPRPRLRLVGDPAVDPQAHARLLARIESLGDASSVVVEHAVPHERMPETYRRARLYVLASEHESFCMPLAECMACGVPAVVRGLSSLRETGGAGAAYVDADEPAAWTRAMRELIADERLYGEAREAAIAAAARFSWEALAADLAARVRAPDAAAGGPHAGADEADSAGAQEARSYTPRSR
jgi:N-acetylglucosaminyl-diphospho-decaprenol L-rhamnosyltransferase